MYWQTFLTLFEEIEAISLMKAFLPLLLYALNFYIGAQVASGRVQLSCQGDVMNSFVDIGGYLLIFGTGIFSLVHAFRKPSTTVSTTITSPVASAIPKVTPPAVTVSQARFSQDPGTPPTNPLP